MGLVENIRGNRHTPYVVLNPFRIQVIIMVSFSPISSFLASISALGPWPFLKLGNSFRNHTIQFPKPKGTSRLAYPRRNQSFIFPQPIQLALPVLQCFQFLMLEGQHPLEDYVYIFSPQILNCFLMICIVDAWFPATFGWFLSAHSSLKPPIWGPIWHKHDLFTKYHLISFFENDYWRAPAIHNTGRPKITCL